MFQANHGAVLPLESTMEAAALEDSNLLNNTPRTFPFRHMFPELQTKADLLEESAKTVEDLKRLGAVGMKDPPVAKAPGVIVPAIYTFFGQFVDHDITREKGSSTISLANPSPIDPALIPTLIVNSRSPNLDLDNVYGPNADGETAPPDLDDENKLLIEKVGPGTRGLVPGKDVFNDFPRRLDGTARIGDERDDENIVVSQLHVAFLRAHNNLVTNHNLTFSEAQKLLIQHYQWIVLDDFLKHVADPDVVSEIRKTGPKFFNPPANEFFMPLEFTVAVFRFGHSKVRASYDQFNSLNRGGELGLLFSNARKRLPEDWIIDWPAFLKPDEDINRPRPIDPSLTDLLLNLGAGQVGDKDPQRNLAVRNLLRAYILRLPTGQAVARRMADAGIPELTADQI
ncbi:MAG TPA: peroxidase family protein, partial [Anaerolineales bacterium]|nr:peroxidase family protein [Anaerolineales bacterium]